MEIRTKEQGINLIRSLIGIGYQIEIEDQLKKMIPQLHKLNKIQGESFAIWYNKQYKFMFIAANYHLNCSLFADHNNLFLTNEKI